MKTPLLRRPPMTTKQYLLLSLFTLFGGVALFAVGFTSGREYELERIKAMRKAPPVKQLHIEILPGGDDDNDNKGIWI
jgi:hypothetical protein